MGTLRRTYPKWTEVHERNPFSGLSSLFYRPLLSVPSVPSLTQSCGLKYLLSKKYLLRGLLAPQEESELAFSNLHRCTKEGFSLTKPMIDIQGSGLHTVLNFLWKTQEAMDSSCWSDRRMVNIMLHASTSPSLNVADHKISKAFFQIIFITHEHWIGGTDDSSMFSFFIFYYFQCKPV